MDTVQTGTPCRHLTGLKVVGLMQVVVRVWLITPWSDIKCNRLKLDPFAALKGEVARKQRPQVSFQGPHSDTQREKWSQGRRTRPTRTRPGADRLGCLPAFTAAGPGTANQTGNKGGKVSVEGGWFCLKSPVHAKYKWTGYLFYLFVSMIGRYCPESRCEFLQWPEFGKSDLLSTFSHLSEQYQTSLSSLTCPHST